MRDVARLIVWHGDGRVLAVVHGGNPRKIGLPGGGIERGELPEQAAVRELREETGLRVTRLIPLGLVEDDGRGWAYYFIAEARGRLRGSHEGPVRWVWPEELFAGKYGAHYARVFDALDS